MSRSLAFPFQIGPLGLPRTSPRARAVREQIEQLLFTIPGERVNRPGFGCGVQRLVFGTMSPEVQATTEYVVRVALHEALSDLAIVNGVRVGTDDATLFVTIAYTLRDTGENQVDTFERPLEGAP